MKPIEERAIEAFHKMWAPWQDTTDFPMEEYLKHYHKDFKGFGSGLTEVWRKQDDMRSYSEGMISRGFKGFTVTSKWLEANEISPGLVCLWGEAVITVPLQSKTIVTDPIRITALFKDEGDHMAIVQWHVSEPDESSDLELWPGTGEPQRFEDVTVMFTDFVGFSNAVATIPAKKLVNDLNEIFAAFDDIVAANGLEKIKTIGDSYMAAGGLKENNIPHAVAVVKTAKELMEYLRQKNEHAGVKWEMRAGIHSGSVVGGVVGSKKLSFDLWGDTVNLASRMESASQPNKINISAYTYELIRDVYPCEYRGKIDTKDKGKLEMYFVN